MWHTNGGWQGKSPDELVGPQGAKFGDITAWQSGIITRGVLLDVPAHRGEPYVTDGNPVTGAELEAISEAQGTPLTPGDALIVYSGREAWQNDNPYPILQLMNIPRSWVFASVDGLNQENSISSGIKEVFFPMPGTMVHKSTGRMKFTPLAETTKNAGLMRVDEFIQASRMGNDQALDIAQGNIIGAPQTIAALIESREESDKETAEETGEETTTTEKRQIRVVYVSDIDVLSPVVFEVRANPEDYQVEDVTWQFENVTFLLNIVDSLAGEKRFIDIRKRKPRHSTLVAVASETAAAITSEYEKRQELRKTQQESIDKYNADTEEEDTNISKEISELEEQLSQLRDPSNPDGIDVARIRELSIEIQLKQYRQQSRQIERARTLTIEQTKNELETEKEIDNVGRLGVYGPVDLHARLHRLVPFPSARIAVAASRQGLRLAAIREQFGGQAKLI